VGFVRVPTIARVRNRPGTICFWCLDAKIRSIVIWLLVRRGRRGRRTSIRPVVPIGSLRWIVRCWNARHRSHAVGRAHNILRRHRRPLNRRASHGSRIVLNQSRRIHHGIVGVGMVLLMPTPPVWGRRRLSCESQCADARVSLAARARLIQLGCRRVLRDRGVRERRRPLARTGCRSVGRFRKCSCVVGEDKEVVAKQKSTRYMKQ
jgi:hypothetical protein